MSNPKRTLAHRQKIVKITQIAPGTRRNQGSLSMAHRLLRLFGALGLAALAGSASASAAVFRWANDGDVSSMDPYTRNETVQLSFLANIYEPLIRRNRELGLEPALAVKWEQTSPTVWRFHLREGVKFTDGTPLSADDVVFSLGRVKSPNSVLRATLASVKEARKVDDLTVDLDTGKPDPILPQELTTFGIMSKAWAEKNNAVEPVNLSSGQ